MSHRGKAGTRMGFTLTEITVVMAGMGLVILLMGTILIGSLRTQQLASSVSTRLLSQNAIAEQFRTDVALATSTPNSLGRLSACSTVLILRMPKGRAVVYRWDDEMLERTEGAGGKWVNQLMPLGDDRATVEFSRSANGRLLTLRLVESLKSGGKKQVVEFSAALGGDLR